MKRQAMIIACVALLAATAFPSAALAKGGNGKHTDGIPGASDGAQKPADAQQPKAEKPKPAKSNPAKPKAEEPTAPVSEPTEAPAADKAKNTGSSAAAPKPKASKIPVGKSRTTKKSGAKQPLKGNTKRPAAAQSAAKPQAEASVEAKPIPKEPAKASGSDSPSTDAEVAPHATTNARMPGGVGFGVELDGQSAPSTDLAVSTPARPLSAANRPETRGVLDTIRASVTEALARTGAALSALWLALTA